MSWKQTANAGYFGESADGQKPQDGQPGYFAQGTDGTVPQSNDGYFGLGGAQGKGYFGTGGTTPNNPAYFGQGDR